MKKKKPQKQLPIHPVVTQIPKEEIEPLSWRSEHHGIVSNTLTRELIKAGIPMQTLLDVADKVWNSGVSVTGLNCQMIREWAK
jgi:hypothetical protein